MQTRAQKDCFGEFSLFYTFLNYVVLFYNLHILFENWKKKNKRLHKKEKSEKEIFLKEGDQKSGTETQPPHHPTKISGRTAIHK